MQKKTVDHYDAEWRSEFGGYGARWTLDIEHRTTRRIDRLGRHRLQVLFVGAEMACPLTLDAANLRSLAAFLIEAADVLDETKPEVASHDN